MPEEPVFEIQISQELIRQIVGETPEEPKNIWSGSPADLLRFPQHVRPPTPIDEPELESDEGKPRFDEFELESDKERPPFDEERPQFDEERDTQVAFDEEQGKDATQDAEAKRGIDEQKEKETQILNEPVVARDLQPLMRVLENTEKHSEELLKRSQEELEETKKRAQELEKKHFSQPTRRTELCAAEKEECINCYRKKPALQCQSEAQAYVECITKVAKSTGS